VSAPTPRQSPNGGGRADRLLILCYHAVSESWPSVGAVTPAALSKQIRYLLRRGYRPRTLTEAMREAPRRRTLVVTFDDAFRSVLTNGLSVLRRLGVPATLFVPTDFAAEGSLMDWSTLGKSVGTAHEEELRCLAWDGVRDLAAAGWEIGSHTASHPRLTQLDAGGVAAELRSSREACEEALQRSCDSLAYPFGDWNANVAELAGREGYRRAVTLGTRPLEPLVDLRRPLELSRDGVYRWTSRPEFFLVSSPALRRVRASSIYRRVRDRRQE
jgi:peptidoglycan/xylan/chitin deacetylase (PgdA/CDA1 family)